MTLFNQDYTADELMGMAVDGKQVSVRYDIHDPSFVLVYTLDGDYVCEAKYEASRRDFFPTPVIDMAREKRGIGGKVAGTVGRSGPNGSIRDPTRLCPPDSHPLRTVREERPASRESALATAWNQPQPVHSALGRRVQ